MPPDSRLTEEQVGILSQWIWDGAVWPAIEIPEDLHADHPELARLRKEHWAWQPLRTPGVPDVGGSDWLGDDVDRFILAGLNKVGLSPVRDADPIVLLRRVTFDLTRLPPTPQEILAFQADRSPAALTAVVDRLLSSPAFGERWGRHWLDVARFGESTGPPAICRIRMPGGIAIT